MGKRLWSLTLGLLFLCYICRKIQYMMKRLILFLITIGCVQFVYSQHSKSPFVHNAKLELTNMVYGDYSFSIEHKLPKNSSLSLRVGYLSPFSNLFKKYEIEMNGNKSGFDASFEYRYFWLGNNKNELQGIYIAPYVRYASLSMNFFDDIQMMPFRVGLNYSNIGAGLQLGYQGRVKSSNKFLNRIVYDFHFLGGGIDRHRIKISYKEMKDSEDFDYGTIKDDIEGYLEKYPFLQKRMDFTALNSLLNIKLPIVLPGLRGGFSVGYAF